MNEIEAVARAVAPLMEGGREFDQMPPTRLELRQWSRSGMCSTNDATQDDATELAQAAIAALDAARGDQVAFQDGVADWVKACFGETISGDQLERADRFTEEALELAQTMPGFTADRAHALVDYVFGRAVGDRNQEVGGVMVTLAALCNTVDLNLEVEGRRELERIWTKVAAIRAKQAGKPTGSALPVAHPPAPDAARGDPVAQVVAYLRETAEIHKANAGGKKGESYHHMRACTWAADAIERGEPFNG